MFDEKEEVFLYALTKRNLEAIKVLKNDINLQARFFEKMCHYTLSRELDTGNIPGELHEIVKVLFNELKMNINKSTVMEKPVLFYYLYYKEFELSEELLTMGSDVNVKVGTGNRSDDNDGWLMEPLICEFIQRMNPERDFPEDFNEQIQWLKSKGANENLEPDLVPFKRVTQ